MSALITGAGLMLRLKAELGPGAADVKGHLAGVREPAIMAPMMPLANQM